MLWDNAENSKGDFLLSAYPHPIFSVKSSGVVLFSEMWQFFMKVVETFVCLLMIGVCINSSESHMAGFIGGFLCTSTYGCILVCIVVLDCRQNGVTWGGIFGLYVFCYGNMLVVFDHPFICVSTNKDISTERRSWFFIIWMFVFIIIKDTNTCTNHI